MTKTFTTLQRVNAVAERGESVTLPDWRRYSDNGATSHRFGKRSDSYALYEIQAGGVLLTPLGAMKFPDACSVWLRMEGDGPEVLLDE